MTYSCSFPTFTAALLALALCAACTNSSTSGNSGGALPGASVSAPAGSAIAGAGVSVPPGATGQAALLSVEPGAVISGGSRYTAVGPAARFGPAGAVFTLPATVTLPFDAGAIPPGFSTEDLVALRQDAGGQVDALPVTVANAAAGLAVTQTTHFTTFQIAVDRNTFTLMPAMLPVAQPGKTYAVDLATSGGTEPFTFFISAGELPPGLALAAATGRISGKPQLIGTYAFTVSVADSLSAFDKAFNATPNLDKALIRAPATASRQYTIPVASLALPDLSATEQRSGATDSKDRALLVDVSRGAVRVQRFEKNGAAVQTGGAAEGVFVVAPAVSGVTLHSPALAVNTADDSFLVVWEQRASATSSVINARRYDDQGAPGAVVQVSDAPGAAVARLPAVAYDGAAYLVAWEDLRNQETSVATGQKKARSDMYARVVAPDGSVDAASFRVDKSDAGTSLGLGPRLAASGKTVLAGWVEAGTRDVSVSTTEGTSTVTLTTQDLLVRTVTTGVPAGGEPARVNPQTVSVGDFDLVAARKGSGFLAAYAGAELVPTDSLGNPLSPTTTATSPSSGGFTVEGARGTCTFVVVTSGAKTNFSLCGEFNPPQDKVLDHNISLAVVSEAGVAETPVAADALPVFSAVHRPALAVSPTGRVLLVWESPLDGAAIPVLMGRMFDESVAATGDAFVVGRGSTARASSMASAEGFFVVAGPGVAMVIDDDPLSFVAAPVLDAEPVSTVGTSNTVSWPAVAGAVDYQVEVATDNTFTAPTITSDFQTATTFTATALTDGQVYFYRVTARNSASTLSAASAVVSSMQDATAPVVAFTAPAAGAALTAGTTFDVTWTTTDKSVVTITMEFAADGKTFTTLFSDRTDRGVFNWKIPATQADVTGAILRISATDAAGNAADTVASGAFSIAAAGTGGSGTGGS